MAEKRFIKGLFKDTSPMDQPAGSWRYARNMVLKKSNLVKLQILIKAR